MARSEVHDDVRRHWLGFRMASVGLVQSLTRGGLQALGVGAIRYEQRIKGLEAELRRVREDSCGACRNDGWLHSGIGERVACSHCKVGYLWAHHQQLLGVDADRCC